MRIHVKHCALYGHIGLGVGYMLEPLLSATEEAAESLGFRMLMPGFDS